MAIYEVTYEEKEEIKSELVEATAPTEAARIFMEQARDRNVIVMCVVRQ